MNERLIFEKALDLEDLEQRKAYIDAACGQDDQLRSRIAALLRSHEQSQSFLQTPPPELVATLENPFPNLIGTQIGPYKLREQIGEGGMGIVYVAEQTEQVKRKVALKIIKPGMASKDVVARFEAERQVLAMMNHPNIAKVFDAGTTDDAGERDTGDRGQRQTGDVVAPISTPSPAPRPLSPPSGQPYFVMELVQGLSITEYCDQHELSTDDRLKLFATVCRAVQHAHQKGIIHRDLKPSNVLVPRIDGQPVPKVIDFGVAKAVGQKLTEQTVYTQFSQLVGTPLYMSPEQAEFGVVDIDTRSDVYSLGVMLYELLTGNTPFDSDTLKNAGFDEMRRIIREDEPPKPSAKVSTLKAEALSTISERRGSDPSKLSASLVGELDSIVMKALEKDRNRRYESASALAADIGRLLENVPILAKPPSAAYRFRKFVRRNRGLVVALVAVCFALSLGAALATVAFLQAGQQRDIARSRLEEISKEQEDNRVLIEILSAMYPRQWGRKTLGRKRTVYDSIEEISQDLDARLRNHPAVEIKVRQLFADAYKSAGENDKAREHLQKALRLAESIYGDQPNITVADIHAALADTYDYSHNRPVDFANLLQHADKAIEIYESLGVESKGLPWFVKGQCLLFTYPMRKAEAEAAQRRAVEINERDGGTSPISRWDLGFVLMEFGDDRLDEAQAEFEKALQVCRDSDPTIKATVLSGLEWCLRRKGDLSNAVKALEDARRLYDSPALGNEPRGHEDGFELVELYFAQGNLTRGFELLNQLEGQLTEASSAQSQVFFLFLKGWLDFQLENYSSAAKSFQESMELAREHFGEQHRCFGYPCAYLGLAYEALGRDDESEKAFRQLLPLTQAYVDQSPAYYIPHWLHARALLASAGNDVSMLQRASDTATNGLAFVSEVPRPWFEPAFQLVMAKLGLRLGTGDRQAAIELLESGLEKAQEPRATYRSSMWDVPTTRCELELMLRDLYLQDGDADDARNVLDQGVRIRAEALGADHIQTAMAQLRLGEFLAANSAELQVAEAEQPLLDAYEQLKPHPKAVNPLRRRAAQALSEVYQAMGRPQDAAKWRAKATRH